MIYYHLSFLQKRIFGNVKFEEHHRTVTLFDVLGNKFIEGHIGAHLPHDDHHYDCKGTVYMFGLEHTAHC